MSSLHSSKWLKIWNYKLLKIDQILYAIKVPLFWCSGVRILNIGNLLISAKQDQALHTTEQKSSIIESSVMLLTGELI